MHGGKFMTTEQQTKKYKTFEDLWIWQEARLLVKLIYQDFGKGTPGHHDYGFKDQIQRAGVSIMNNTSAREIEILNT